MKLITNKKDWIMKKLRQGLTLLTCLAASFSMIFASQAMAEDWAQIEADAKKEGQLLVYSTTSRTAKAAEAFTKLTGVKVEVVRLKEQELITRSYQEAQSGVHKVDMVVGEDWPAARELLNNTGYLSTISHLRQENFSLRDIKIHWYWVTSIECLVTTLKSMLVAIL
jgi:spermidine/putrescine-binding protein